MKIYYNNPSTAGSTVLHVFGLYGTPSFGPHLHSVASNSPLENTFLPLFPPTHLRNNQTTASQGGQ